MGMWGLSLYSTLGRAGGPTKSTWTKEGGCKQLVAVIPRRRSRCGHENHLLKGRRGGCQEVKDGAGVADRCHPLALLPLR